MLWPPSRKKQNHPVSNHIFIFIQVKFFLAVVFNFRIGVKATINLSQQFRFGNVATFVIEFGNVATSVIKRSFQIQTDFNRGLSSSISRSLLLDSVLLRWFSQFFFSLILIFDSSCSLLELVMGQLHWTCWSKCVHSIVFYTLENSLGCLTSLYMLFKQPITCKVIRLLLH